LLKKPFTWFFLAAVVAFFAFRSFPDNKLHLVFCNVGQGDAILLYYHSTQVLIDGGPNQQVLECLSKHVPFWDRRLEAVVLTHAESDHLTGLIDVIHRYQVQQFILNDLNNNTAIYQEFSQAVKAEKTKVYSPQKGDQIKFGKITLNVLWPSTKMVLGVSSTNLNEEAIVLSLNYGHFDALLTGDTEIKTEESLHPNFADKALEVLKVAHHGSKTSTGEEFLKRIKPALAVISVGKNNRYGHPTDEVLERLTEVGAKILRTDLAGEIEVVSDGAKWYTR
jgi:competence protein ComEC